MLHFIHQDCVDICPLSETFLDGGEAVRLANVVFQPTERPRAGGGTAILVRRVSVHQSLPVPELTCLEATAVNVTLTADR
jgi:hypothetical protein